MEFWGTEVGPGKPQVNAPGEDTYCHVSQAALGPSKDGKSERVVIRVETGGKNVVLGTLVSGKVDQMSLDLIFDRDFTLSHTSTSSSVFFCGYKTEKGGEEYTSEEESEGDEEDDEDDDEEVPEATPIVMKENGAATAKEIGKAIRQKASLETGVTTASQAPKAKSKKGAQPKNEPLNTSLVDDEALEGEDTDDSEESDEDDDEGEATMNSMVKMELDSDDEEDDSEFEADDLSSDDEDEEDEDSDEDEDDDEEDEDEEDVAAELGKKRQLKGADEKTPPGGKKARLDTPAKPGLITTPAKKAGAKGDVKSIPASTGKKSSAKEPTSKTPEKTPAKEKSVKTPKSVSPGGDSAKTPGAHHCAECKKNFASESALGQHSAAKHKK